MAYDYLGLEGVMVSLLATLCRKALSLWR